MNASISGESHRVVSSSIEQSSSRATRTSGPDLNDQLRFDLLLALPIFDSTVPEQPIPPGTELAVAQEEEQREGDHEEEASDTPAVVATASTAPAAPKVRSLRNSSFGPTYLLPSIAVR